MWIQNRLTKSISLSFFKKKMDYIWVFLLNLINFKPDKVFDFLKYNPKKSLT